MGGLLRSVVFRGDANVLELDDENNVVKAIIHFKMENLMVSGFCLCFSQRAERMLAGRSPEGWSDGQWAVLTGGRGALRGFLVCGRGSGAYPSLVG